MGSRNGGHTCWVTPWTGSLLEAACACSFPSAIGTTNPKRRRLALCRFIAEWPRQSREGRGERVVKTVEGQSYAREHIRSHSNTQSLPRARLIPKSATPTPATEQIKFISSSSSHTSHGCLYTKLRVEASHSNYGTYCGG